MRDISYENLQRCSGPVEVEKESERLALLYDIIG